MRGVLAFLLLAALAFVLLVTRPEDGARTWEVGLGLAAIAAAWGARTAWRGRDR